MTASVNAVWERASFKKKEKVLEHHEANCL
jgi:hypothetical protein